MEATAVNKTERRISWGLVVTALTIFLAALDQTVIITVLPEVVYSLNLTIDEAFGQGIWVITGYLLGYTVAMPLLGRVADVYGHRRLFALSMLIFGVGSIGCALAGSVPTLVAWRIIQAIGGGAVLPIGLAIAMDQVKPINHATALGLLGAAGEAGGVLGPAYGGIVARINLLGIDGWRWVFWLNIPLLAVLLVALYRTLPEHQGSRTRIDYVGGLLLGVALTTLTIALSRSLGSLAVDPALTEAGVEQFAVDWTSPQTLLLLGLSLASLIGFVLWERRVHAPLIDIRTFRIAAFSAANATNLLVGAALIIGMVNVPFFASTVLGMDSLGSGLLLIRLTVMIPIGAVIGGLLMRRISGRTVAALGMLLTALGFWRLSTWPLEIGAWQSTVDLLLTGSGFGLVLPALSAAAIGSVDHHSMGTAAGLLNTIRMIGITLGIAALASWSLTQRTALLAKIDFSAANAAGTLTEEIIKAELAVYHATFLAGALICLLALVPIWWLPKEPGPVDAPLFA